MKHILIILVSVLFISACSQTGGSNPMGLNTSVTDGFAGFNNKMKQLSIGMSEPAFSCYLATNNDYLDTEFYYGYSSPKKPRSIFKEDIQSGESDLVWQQLVKL